MIERWCEAPGCGRLLPARRRRFCSDECQRRGKRAERVRETPEFGAAAIRMIRALARRVGASDLAEFGLMWEIMAEADRAVFAAAQSLHAAGCSWGEMAAAAGTSKQALWQWCQRRERAAAHGSGPAFFAAEAMKRYAANTGSGA